MSRIVTPPVSPTTPPVAVPQEKIAQRAYEKWLKRGCIHGNDRQDWLEAELELKAEFNRPAAKRR